MKFFCSLRLALLVAPFFLTAAAHAQGGSANPAGAAKASGGESNTTTQTQTGQPATEGTSSQFFTGSYQATGNFSLLGQPKPSLGHRLNLSHALDKGSIDTRLEYYVDGSYNGDPPGVLRNNINEPKFEGQIMYNRPLTSRLGFTGGLLYHDNFKFPDRYYWVITGLTYTLPLGEDVTLSSAALIEKKLGGARFFYDLSSTLEYRFAPKWNTQLALHRYENVGQFDPRPTQKGEIEIGLNRALTEKQSVGISFFRHVQFDAPNDQFSFLKLKYSVGF
jgi:hypothetical protein